MLLVLENSDEEQAIRQGTITVSELIDRIKENDLNPILTIGIDKNINQGINWFVATTIKVCGWKPVHRSSGIITSLKFLNRLRIESMNNIIKEKYP